MNADGLLQSSLWRIVLTCSIIIVLGLVLFSVQSVIRALRNSDQAAITNPTSVAQEQISPEPAVPTPAISAPAGVQSGQKAYDFSQDFEAIRQREKAEQETIRSRAKEAQENPNAGSISAVD